MKKFDPIKNTLRKEDFNSFVLVLKDSLQDYLDKTKERNISLLGLTSLVETSLNKAEAHKAIRDRVKAKVKENSSSKASLMQYLYNFILCNDNQGTINL